MQQNENQVSEKVSCARVSRQTMLAQNHFCLKCVDRYEYLYMLMSHYREKKSLHHVAMVAKSTMALQMWQKNWLYDFPVD